MNNNLEMKKKIRAEVVKNLQDKKFMKKIETEYYNKKIAMQKTNNKSTLNLSKLIPNILAVETLHIKDGCEEGQIHYLNNLQDEAEFLRLLSIALKRIAKGLYVDERTYIETVPNKKFLSTKMFVYSYSEFSAIRIYTDADYLKRMFMD